MESILRTSSDAASSSRSMTAKMSATTTTTTTTPPTPSSGGMNWEPVRKRLLGADLNLALRAASELRERIEIVYTTEFPGMLSSLLPAFSSVLSRCTRPNPDPSSVEHKLRNVMLEIMSRMPNNEVLRPYAPQVLSTAMDVLTRDYEENALIASRVIFDLHKNYRPALQDQVQPFLDFVISSYRALPVSVQRNFFFHPEKKLLPPPPQQYRPQQPYGTPQQQQLPTPSTTPAGAVVSSAQKLLPPPTQHPQPLLQTQQQSTAVQQQTAPPGGQISPPKPQSSTMGPPPSVSPATGPQTPSAPAPPPSSSTSPPAPVRLSLKSISSFRVLTECPLTVMLLFQLYPKYIKTNIPTLINLMMEALALRPPPIKSVAPANHQLDPDHKPLYQTRARELLATQVKTLSFLTYLLRGFAEQMKPYEDRIAGGVVSLLSSCPREAVSTRRELLASTRQILSTDFRRGFVRHIDAFLDERVMLGSHRASEQPSSLRPLAYSALADMTNHVRSRLTLDQFGRVVQVFSRMLHDLSASVPIAVQVAAVRVLLNSVDHVFHNRDPDPRRGRDLLGRILNIFVKKFGTLQYYIPVVEQAEVRKKEEAEKERKRRAKVIPSDTREKDVHVHGDEKGGTPNTSSEAEGRKYMVATTLPSVDAVDVATTEEEAEAEENRMRRVRLSSGEAEVADTLDDLRALIKPMVLGLKTLIWCVDNYRQQQEKERTQAADPNVAGGAGNSASEPIQGDDIVSTIQRLTESERELIRNCIVWVFPCLKVFQDSNDHGGAIIHETSTSTSSSAKSFTTPAHSAQGAERDEWSEYREVLDNWAASLSVLSGFNLRRTIGLKLSELFDAMREDEKLLGLPKHLLMTSQTVSYDFCDVLLGFLVKRMKELPTPCQQNSIFVASSEAYATANSCVDGETEKVGVVEEDLEKTTSLLLYLFEMIFNSMSVFPENEAALRPRLQQIVRTCLRSATEKRAFWPGNYLLIVRALFRCISGCKLEESYKELLPLLPTILNGLYRIFVATDDRQLRYLTIELCLTIPARLSSLLPHISLLLRFIIPALQSKSGDLVNLGLRTLEFWVDNLNPDFLYPLLAHQTTLLTDLMLSLTNHLRPAPYPYGLLTLRLLGKLGGRSRQFLREATDFDLDSNGGSFGNILSIECGWRPSDLPENPMGERAENRLGKGRESKIDSDVDRATEKGNAADIDGINEKLDSFALPLPFNRAVEVLKLVAFSQTLEAAIKPAVPSSDDGAEIGDYSGLKDSQESKNVNWRNVPNLFLSRMELVDFTTYCTDVMEETRRHQAASALAVVRASLAAVLELPQSGDDGPVSLSQIDIGKFVRDHNADMGMDDSKHASTQPISTAFSKQKEQDAALKRICEGLFYAALSDFLRDEAQVLLKGLSTHMLLIIASHRQHVIRIDANGNILDDHSTVSSYSAGGSPSTPRSSTREAFVVNSKLQPLTPFGCFHLSGPLYNRASPFKFNEALVEILCQEHENSQSLGIDMILYLVQLAQRLGAGADDSFVHAKTGDDRSVKWVQGSDVFFENLLSVLCQACFSNPWNLRSAALRGIGTLATSLGSDWARVYEVEIMHVALFVVKDSPREISCAATESLSFYFNMCAALYGGPPRRESALKKFIYDVLSLPDMPSSSTETGDGDTKNLHKAVIAAPEPVLNLIIGEVASTKQLLRFAVRHSLQYLSTGMVVNDMLKKHASAIKRILFSRSLRIVPLPEQVGVVEALAFLVEVYPDVIPVSDQHLLAFLSEILKMTSIADGEMPDASSSGVLIDKNGYATNSQEGQIPASGNNLSPQAHVSALFLRRECILDCPESGKIVVPAELPYGVQLRVSTLMLFRAVIRRHTDVFFDAPSSTTIGNIRPHVISLLFRSLISDPPEAVRSAHATLKDVLFPNKEKDCTAASQSLTRRLPKELLQTCIRPHLLNLRDYTKLNVPLLRGLSRLLSLLSSWFNKTLGEKLVDHLQKWTDPDRIISHRIWKEGEEPFVAASIIDLFHLLPKAPNFVEPLVKMTIKLEAVWLPVNSPFRAPLARYLNKYGEHVVSFFFTEPRLKNPLYSDLFQEIIRLDETEDLRTYISGKECSALFLNLCFERPLAIVRSEKTATNPGSKSPTAVNTPRRAAELLAMHGIQTEAISSSQKQREAALRQEIELKQKKVQMMQQEEARTREAYQARFAISATAGAPAAGQVDSQPVIQEAQRQHQLAQSALEKGQKELNNAKQIYADEMAKIAREASNSSESDSPRPMTMDALELQIQGFRLVDTLIKKNKDYLRGHNDVVRAFRWLWRSKGRHLRLHHEHSLPIRFHDESRMLASFLINYSQAYPDDVDVLFDLLRIFLQPTVTDFSFVKRFLERMLSEILTTSQKRRVIQRFFVLLASEGSEETKVLSIQLIILPLLRSDFSRNASCCTEGGQPPIKGSWIAESSVATSGEGKEADAKLIAPREQAQVQDGLSQPQELVVDSDIIQKFVKEALVQSGGTRRYGDRLNVELLKVSNMLLEFMWRHLTDHRKDIIKFSWNLLKSEDHDSKNWAYVNVCQFIKVFETPSKIIFQVYLALLRSYQQESKELVRSALDILIPALPRRLVKDDFNNAMKYTSRIMYEEGNSVPHLAHIWQCIVRNPQVFFSHRHHFIPHMVNSLNRLGLPQHCPHENRILSASMVELVLLWEEAQCHVQRQCILTKTLERENPASDFTSNSSEKSDSDAEAPSQKRMRTAGGSPYPNVFPPAKSDKRESVKLDQSMADTVANFLVRLTLLVADSKVDGARQTLGNHAADLFRRVMSKWAGCTIQAVYFDKVVSMCVEETSGLTTKPAAKTSDITEKKVREKTGKSRGSSKSSAKAGKTTAPKASSSSTVPTASSSKQKADFKPVSCALLSACLDLFVILLQSAPPNRFLLENSTMVKDILGPCFARAKKTDEGSIRRKLKSFLVSLFSQRHFDAMSQDVMCHIKVLLEKAIVDATNLEEPAHSSGAKVARNQHAGTDDAALEHVKIGCGCDAYYIVQIIEEVSRQGNTEFVEDFLGTLIALTEKLTKNHVQNVTTSKRNIAPSMQQLGGSALQHATPVISIMKEACRIDFAASTVGGNAKHRVVNDRNVPAVKNVPDVGTALRTLISCIRLIGYSSVPYAFTESRKAFIQNLSNILDSSDNVQLLMTTVSIVGTWLLSEGGSPLTLKERSSFVWKMTDFYSHGLPEVASQPLVDMVSHVVLSMHKFDSPEVGGSRRDDVSGPTGELIKLNESEDMLLGRSLVSCLLNANPFLRPLLIGLYVTQKKDFASVQEELSVVAGKTGCRSNDSIDVAGIPGRTPLDLLWQLLHSDFEGLAGRFWIVVFVDCLIAASVHYGGVRLVSEDSFEKGGAGIEQGTEAGPQNQTKSIFWLVAPLFEGKMKNTVNDSEPFNVEYIGFCEKVAREQEAFHAGRGRVLAAIRALAHGDSDLSQDLFQRMLFAAWEKLRSDDLRLALASALESLLARPFHSQFLNYSRSVHSERVALHPSRREVLGFNVIQAVLRAVSLLRPMPVLDTDLIVSLAADYNSWHEVLCILEKQRLVLTKRGRSHGTVQYEQQVTSVIRQCYRRLGETDVWLALSSESCNMDASKWAISLDTYGKVTAALDAYSELVDQVESNESSFGASEVSAPQPCPSDFEMCLWEDRWIELQKEMCQWEVIADYAESTGSPRLLMESAWKSKDWNKVKTLLSSPSITAALEGGDPDTKMNEIFLAIAESNLTEVENLHAQTAQLCLYKWLLLPKISSSSCAHASLLQTFQRLVELRESGQIMVETRAHSAGRTLPDLKNLLSAWRHRLPNEFEPISVWENVFLWRSHMFSAITTSFHWSEPGTLATLHDRPWTAIRMARTARKQGLKEVALLSLSKLTDCAMDVSDAFAKLREQILAYHNADSELERTGGLNLINTTNLSFFDASQKSELFRLKASFLASLGGRSKANQAYCHAVQICPSYSRAWLSWGGLCSSLAELTERQSESQSSTPGGTDVNKEVAAAAAKKVAQYLAQAMGCYLEAIRCDGHEWCRIHLPRCLWMLTKDGSTPGVLCQTLETRGILLPPWVWIPWIPQLLTSLCRVEARTAKAILTGVAKTHPQAVYFALRAFYLERRDIERSRGTASSGGQHQQHGTTAVAHAEELMSSLRKANPTLWSCLESILEELIVRFRPSYEEELLTTVTALLQRAESQNEQATKNSTEDLEAVLASFAKTLGRISAKFFRTTPPDATVSNKDDRVKKTADFKRRYRAAFESDFMVDAGQESVGDNHGVCETFQQQPLLSLSDITERLKKWKRLLDKQVSATPNSLPLLQCSPFLSCFSSEAPDLWSGSCDPMSSKPTVELSDTEMGNAPSSPSSSAAAALTAASAAALAVQAAAAVEGGGGKYGGGSASVEIPGQYVPNSSSSFDSKPRPELHVKLIRFESTIEVKRKSEQQLIRRIGMLGSDGKIYHFLLQFAIPYSTRTDERTAQLNYLVGKLLRRGMMSSQRYLSVEPSAVIPIAQRLRMTLDDESHTSLDEVYRLECDALRADYDAPQNFFQEEVAKQFREMKSSDSVEIEPSVEKSVKLKAFQTVCANMVDPHTLKNRMQAILESPEQFFSFRRAFAGDLAVNSLLQYVFCVVERTPSRFLFNARNGRMLSPDFRFAYNNQGFLEGNSLPFRFTRNVEYLFGPLLVPGAIIPAMASAASAIDQHKEDVDPALRLLLRDDIVSWYTSKSMARSDTKTQDLERQLADRVIKNVSLVQERVLECVPEDKNTKGNLGSKPVDARIKELFAAASDAENLCMMPYGYQPWL